VSTLPTDINPADVAIEMLTEALPGFASQLVDGRDSIGIRGALPIAADVSRDLIFYPLYRAPIYMSTDARAMFDAIETDEARKIRHARQREVLRHELGPTLQHVIDEIRRRAIDAVGLEPVIVERERVARERGMRAGYDAGREKGRREGRAELLREWQEAADTLRGMLDEMPGVDDVEE